MKLFIVILTILLTWTEALNITEDVTANKTKRTLASQLQNYGDNRPVLLYHENPQNVHPQTLASLYAPANLQPDLSKQVAAQQVLYEFQQTPTNAVSNVHVNQFYQPVPKENTGPAQFVTGSESVANPVQHSTIIRHGQNFGQVQYNPFPQHVQTQQYVPGKLLYVNGKITYPQNGYQQQNGGQKPMNYITYVHPQTGAQKLVPPPLVLRPAGYRRFSPPNPQQLQQITKPMNVPKVKEEQNEEQEKPVKKVEEEEEEDVEEEEDEKESYEEDDDEDRYFSKYSFDDDEDKFKEEEEDEDDDDNARGSSKPIAKKHKKKIIKSNKYPKGDGFKYTESYSSSHKYEKPTKKSKKIVRNHPKSSRYFKDGGRLSRNEKIEGKQSQNVPVVHKQKIFKEKWFVTKSTDDSIL